MYEYIFFAPVSRDQFIEQLDHHKVPYQIDAELTVAIPEDIEDEVTAALDEHYEELLHQTPSLFNGDDALLEKDVAGVQVQLQNGSISTIRIPPELVSRILTSISMEEFRDLCQLVAEGVEIGDNSPLCHNI